MQVYAALRDAIVRAELEPGRRLSENELAARLGVSRTPVREALARLRDERLVEIVPQLGTYVTRISPQAVADAQFVREALECAAIRRSAERASDEDVAALEDNLRAQERAQRAKDWDSLYLLDDQFHRVLCDASGHATVWLVSQRAKGHLNRVRRLSLPRASFIEEVIAEHRLVIDAVCAHDPDLAERELRQHLQLVPRELPRIRAEHPDFFEEP
ncbi:MAG TPA: GntR family transcriptional regulator [Thermoleophilaceae bacterium]|nr:GntR family transcriptional regulator [Thermoleophilaceae bacterium]